MRESNHINQMNNEPIKDDGGAAFPMHERDDALRGMSLRDYFAGQALTGYAAYHPASIMGPSIEKTAALAYEYADAMLKARADSANDSENTNDAAANSGCSPAPCSGLDFSGTTCEGAEWHRSWLAFTDGEYYHRCRQIMLGYGMGGGDVEMILANFWEAGWIAAKHHGNE